METKPEEEIQDVQETTCCVVGGGPAGVILSLLLARWGVRVILLEAHKDFDRDFRGDTIHPSTLEILDQIELARPLLEIPHGKIECLKFITSAGELVLGDLRRLQIPFPFVAMLPQAQFLDFLAHQAEKFPSFRRVMGANVQRVVEENGKIRGVRYRGADDRWHEIRAVLTVAADGRFSKIRTLVGLEPRKTSPPMDVVWFRLPRKSEDGQDSGAIYIQAGHFAVLLDRGDQWQIGFVILKGSFHEIRARGLEGFRQALVETVPSLSDRVNHLEDWKQVSILSVESSRLEQWYKPGLLLIGDAAHVMSPVGGVGINYAIQDAVEAANILVEPLRQGRVEAADLAAVQKCRQFPVRLIQTFQSFLQKRIAVRALDASRPFTFPLILRLILKIPGLRNLPARMIAYGIRKVRVRELPAETK